MAHNYSISMSAAGLATGAITSVLADTLHRTGVLPDAGNDDTYRKALRLLDRGTDDPEALSLAKELIRSRIVA